jgi:hypothetical protein
MMTKYIIKPFALSVDKLIYKVCKVGFFTDDCVCLVNTIEEGNIVIQHLEQNIEQVPKV